MEKLIKEQMAECVMFELDYCDSYICPACPLCNRNIALEYYKTMDICPKCHGYDVTSLMHGFRSITRICNLCGGTGEYPKN